MKSEGQDPRGVPHEPVPSSVHGYELDWLRQQLEVHGYKALPCGDCRRDGSISVDALYEALAALVERASKACRYCGVAYKYRAKNTSTCGRKECQRALQRDSQRARRARKQAAAKDSDGTQAGEQPVAPGVERINERKDQP